MEREEGEERWGERGEEREGRDHWPDAISVEDYPGKDLSSDCYSLSVLVEGSIHQPGTVVEWPLHRELVR